MNPDISVVIPVYNGQRFIEESVNSALAQTDVNIEVLAVDDCSEDETPNIVQNIMKTDDRLYYIRTLTNEGVAGARNIGAEAASGKWVAFLDPNDKWHSDKLLRQYELVKQYDDIGKHPPLCYTGAYVMNDDGSFAGRVIKAQARVSSHDLLMGNVILPSTAMVRRECLLECPFERGSLHEDYIEWFRLLSTFGAAVGVSLPLVRYRLTKRAETRSKLKAAFTAWQTYKYLGLSTPRTLISLAYYLKYNALI